MKEIEINFISEKYINCPAPVITSRIKDWALLTLWQSVRHKDIPNKIEKVTIRVNKSYEGSSLLHFYITFNNEKHSHYKQLSSSSIINDDLLYLDSSWEPSYLSAFEQKEEWQVNSQSIPKRWTWVLDFVNNGVDMLDTGRNALAQVEYNRKLNTKLNELIQHKQSKTRIYNMALRDLKKYGHQVNTYLMSELEIKWLSEEQFIHWFDNSKIIHKTRFGVCTL